MNQTIEYDEIEATSSKIQEKTLNANILMFEGKWMKTYQIENILRNPNKEKSTDYIRNPQGGEVFLWISDKINDYVVDDFTWTHNGRHLLPESAPVIESNYYKAKMDKVVSNRIGLGFITIVVK